MQGSLITFEGIEGCGKTTQLALAASALRQSGQPVLITREPGGTVIGDVIRALLLDTRRQEMTPLTELLLYAAARAQHVTEVIRPALERGDTVLVDRFADSTTAYQGAARQLDTALVHRLAQAATAGLQPHLTLVFDLPVTVGLARVAGRARGRDRLEQETAEFHERVRQAYVALARQHPQRIVVIDADRPVDQIHRDVVATVQKLNRSA